MLRTLLLAAFTLFSTALAALDVSASSDGLRWIGRFTADYRCAWSGSAMETIFTGTSLTLRVEGNKSWLAVVIDDQEPIAVGLKKGQSEYPITDALAPGDHRLLVFTRTEGHAGPIRFLGLRLDDGATVRATPARKRRISVLGDSISCGYGNEASKPEDNFRLDQENAYLTYWAITARNLDADWLCCAFSGRGIWRNRDGKDPFKDTMPAYWERILPFDPTTTVDHSQYVSDVHIVNLGTNDVAIDMPPREGFQEAVREHIATVRTHAPEAHIFLCVGPMLGGEKKKTIRSYYQDIVTTANDPRLHYLEFAGQKSGGIGAHWHPNVVTHRLMAEQLTTAIRAAVGW